MGIKNKIVSIVMTIVMLFALAIPTNAETVSLTSSGTNFTSTKYSSAPGNQYYAKLTSVSYNGIANNTFPYGASITVNLYYSGGSDIPAGTSETISAVNSPVYPAVDSKYRSKSGNYKLFLQNNYSSLACTVGVSWTP